MAFQACHDNVGMEALHIHATPAACIEALVEIGERGMGCQQVRGLVSKRDRGCRRRDLVILIRIDLDLTFVLAIANACEATTLDSCL